AALPGTPHARATFLAPGQTPERERSLFQRLGVRGSAGIRIGFRRRQHRNRAFVLGYPVQRAVPETEVALPAFEVALRLGDDGKLLFGFALERRQNERLRRISDEPADRDDARAAFDFINDAAALRAVDDSIQGGLQD